MPNGTRNTAGINTTANQQKYRGRGLENRMKTQTPEQYAKDWLSGFLAEGPVAEKDVQDRAQEMGFDRLLLMRAKIELGVESLRQEDGSWSWSMPEKPLEEEEANDALAAAFAIDRTKPGEDEFSLSSEELKSFGIQSHEDYAWIRDPRVWEDTRVAPGRVRQFKTENPGGEPVKFKGDFVTCGSDLILVKRPRKLVEQMQARELMREQAYFGELANAEHSGRMSDDEFDPRDDEAKIARKAENTRQNIEAGRIGPMSPSSGMAYEDYIRFRGLSSKDIEREEIQSALGLGADVDQVMEELSSRRQSQGRDGGSGRFISIPQNVRPRNLMKGAAK